MTHESSRDPESGAPTHQQPQRGRDEDSPTSSDDTGRAPEPFHEIELPDGSDPISKGIVRRVREVDGTVVVDVAVDGLGDGLAERVVERVRGAALALPGAEHVRIEPVRRADDVVELPELDRCRPTGAPRGRGPPGSQPGAGRRGPPDGSDPGADPTRDR